MEWHALLIVRTMKAIRLVLLSVNVPNEKILNRNEMDDLVVCDGRIETIHETGQIYL